MKPELTLEQIIKIIVEECRNSCHDAHSTFIFFDRHFNRPENTRKVDMQLLRLVVKMINFAGVRENSDALYQKLAS